MASSREDDSLVLGGDDEQDLWKSPAKKRGKEENKQNTKLSSGAHPMHTDDATREESLRQELANVRKVNEAIEGVLSNLEKAKGNMKTVNQTVGAASSLLNTWTRILSQTEHNQRLILDPAWQGSSQDIADIEEEALAKQHAAERREQEEQERKALAVQKAEEEEKRRADAAKTVKTTSTRGRGRGFHNPSSSVAGASANTSMSSVSRGSMAPRRAAGGIGRGASSRARGRG